MKSIEIVEVWRILLENPDLKFEIAFVRANGKKKGSIKKTKLGLMPQKKGELEPNASKRKYLHKDKLTLPLFNYDTQRPETPLYNCVIEFEGQKVIY